MRYFSKNRRFYPSECNRLVGRSWFLVISHILPHLILMQPDGICVPSDELVHIHAVNGWRSLDSLLLSVDEDGHVLLLPPFPFCLLSSSEFSFTLCHD